jgi:hypothetical protein
MGPDLEQSAHSEGTEAFAAAGANNKPVIASVDAAISRLTNFSLTLHFFLFCASGSNPVQVRRGR